MRTVRALVAALALVTASVAHADSFVVESAPHSSRAEAEALLQRILVETGDARARVVRRYVRGEGWRYLVALEGVASQGEAAGLEARFRSEAGPAQIWRLGAEGREAVGEGRAVAAPAPAPAPPPGAAPAPPPSKPDKRTDKRDQKDADALLLAAVEAHGGPEGGRKVLEAAPSVRFRYRRRLPRGGGELVVQHDFVRRGREVAVRIQVEDGDGVDSHILVGSSGHAWVRTADGVVARDPQRTREILSRFSPEGLLSVPLGFPADLAVASAWRGLRPAGRSAGTIVLRHPGGVSSGAGPDGLVEAVFAESDHRLVRVRWREGGVVTTLRYGHYTVAAPGLVVPGTIEVEVDGRLVESLEVLELRISGEIPPEMLKEPEG